MPSRAVPRIPFGRIIVFPFVAAVTGLLVYLLLGLDPNKVTAVGTAVAAVATAVLAWFGWVQIWAARRQQRAVAAALLEDVRRIRTELGPPPKPGEDPLVVDPTITGYAADRAVIRRDAVIPEVHRWVSPVIHQIAESDAGIVGSFLRLDRDLNNYKARIRDLLDAEQLRAESHATLDRWLRGTRAPWGWTPRWSGEAWRRPSGRRSTRLRPRRR